MARFVQGLFCGCLSRGVRSCIRSLLLYTRNNLAPAVRRMRTSLHTKQGRLVELECKYRHALKLAWEGQPKVKHCDREAFLFCSRHDQTQHALGKDRRSGLPGEGQVRHSRLRVGPNVGRDVSLADGASWLGELRGAWRFARPLR